MVSETLLLSEMKLRVRFLFFVVVFVPFCIIQSIFISDFPSELEIHNVTCGMLMKLFRQNLLMSLYLTSHTFRNVSKHNVPHIQWLYGSRRILYGFTKGEENLILN